MEKCTSFYFVLEMEVRSKVRVREGKETLKTPT